MKIDGEDMKTNPHIFQFLQGILSEKEMVDFLHEVRNDPILEQKLYEESGFESAFYSQQWPQTSELNSTSRFASDVTSSLFQINNTHQPSLYTIDHELIHKEWQNLINKSIQLAHTSLIPTFFLPSLFSSPRKIIITLLLLFSLITSIFFFMTKSSKTDNLTLTLPITVSSSDESTLNSPPDSLISSNLEHLDSLTMNDRINEITVNKNTQAFITLPATEKKMVYLTSTSGFLAEHKAQIQVLENTDSIVIISLGKGSAVFKVEENSYQRFSVITPHLEVRVTGTVFRVLVTPTKSKVTLIEGTVLITSVQGIQDILTVSGNNTVIISPDSLIKAMIHQSHTLNQRKNLLKNYLRHMGQVQKEFFATDKIITSLHSQQLELFDSFSLISDPIIQAQIMHFRLGQNYIKKHLIKKAITQLKKVYQEKPQSGINELAWVQVCLLSYNHEPYAVFIEYLEKYIDIFFQGWALPEIMVLHIGACLRENDYERALPYMIQFIQQFPSSPFTDNLAFILAQYYRQQLKDPANALLYYEYITSYFPQSPYHEDALYWTGWCLVQKRFKK